MFSPVKQAAVRAGPALREPAGGSNRAVSGMRVHWRNTVSGCDDLFGSTEYSVDLTVHFYDVRPAEANRGAAAFPTSAMFMGYLLDTLISPAVAR